MMYDTKSYDLMMILFGKKGKTLPRKLKVTGKRSAFLETGDNLTFCDNDLQIHSNVVKCKKVRSSRIFVFNIRDSNLSSLRR